MSRALFLQTLRRARVRLIACIVGAALWGFLAPVIYVSVLAEFAKAANLPSVMTHFGSGNIATLTGTITTFYEHPFLIAILATITVGTASPAIAGARQHGTLEMWLARPISRVRVALTLALATALMLALALIALIGSTVVSAAVSGHGGDVPLASLPLVWLNAMLLYGAFAAFALAASASNNRPGPATGLTLAYLLINYLIEVLAPLWEPLRSYQSLSLFHHFQPGAIFDGAFSFGDAGILAAALLIPAAWVLVVFPRRDLAAPD